MCKHVVEEQLAMADIAPVIQERLAAGQSVRFSPRGISMLPMIRQGKDSVVLSAVRGRLKKYDIPLYRRDDGKYILHRIMDVSDTYTCIGDHQYVQEKGVRQDQVIAVVTAFYRGEKRYEVSHAGYRVYCILWHWSRPVRHLMVRAKRWLRRHLV